MQHLSRSVLESLNLSSREIVDYLEHLMQLQVKDAPDQRVMAAPKAALAPGDGRYLMATLSMMDEPPIMAVKSLLVNQANTAQGGEAINATIILMHSQTGEPLATVDGNWVTAIRTAAASALAARYLAREDSQQIAFIGCGVQAQSHLQLFSDLYPLSGITALGKGTKNRDALCATAEQMGLQAQAAQDAREAVTEADIIISSIPLTAQIEPFIDAHWLKPGACAISTDAGLPWMDTSMRLFERLVIDDFKQEAVMPKPMVNTDWVLGDLPGLIAGQVAPRQTAGERTAFVYRSVPLGDLALAALAYQRFAGE